TNGGKPACISSVRFMASGRYYFSVAFGVDRATFTSLSGFARRLDEALRSCDAAALGPLIGFPLTHRHHFLTPDADPQGLPDEERRYSDAAALTQACLSGSPLQLGYGGYNAESSLDADAARATASSPGELKIGSEMTNAIVARSQSGNWRATRIDT